jgi:hypothetical protein
MMHQGWTDTLLGDYSICLNRLMSLELFMMDLIWMSQSLSIIMY